jgi:hypothetical protein
MSQVEKKYHEDDAKLSKEMSDFHNENFEIYCSFDKKTKKLTGAICHPNSKKYRAWRAIEFLTIGIGVKKMWALDFLDTIIRQGIDLEKYVEILES